MDNPVAIQIEYVEARRVLLNALDALRPHQNAIVLIGAQAVYLRTVGRLPTYQPFTTDADLVVDPSKLLATHPLDQSMRDAGFLLTDEPGIWEARFKRTGFVDEIVVPVDLIVPDKVASRAGRRSARLPGDLGKNTARKCIGVEGALVDFGSIEIASLELIDARSIIVNVAGEAALLVAKLHKLGDRLNEPKRLEAKDVGDIYRLFDAVAPDEMGARLKVLLADERSATTTLTALKYAEVLFGTPSGIGVRLGVEALRAVIPEATVSAFLIGYWKTLDVLIQLL